MLNAPLNLVRGLGRRHEAWVGVTSLVVAKANSWSHGPVSLSSWLFCAALIASLAGCGSTRVRAPTLPSAEELCRASSGMANPVVAEWNAAERPVLARLIRQGAIGVVYTGCELRLLPGCTLPGRYTWHRTTTFADEFTVSSANELGAKLPLARVELRATLESYGTLRLLTTVIGELELEGHPPESVGYVQACNEATHLVRGISVGATELRAVGGSKFDAGLDAYAFSASSTGQSLESVVHRTGDLRTCTTATEVLLPTECAAPIQLHLEPIARMLRPQIAGAPLSVRFLSSDSDVSWEVQADGRTLCQTPCSQVLAPTDTLFLRASGTFMMQEQRVEVPDLQSYAGQDHLAVRAKPRSVGELGGGVVMTTFGGLAAVAGTALLSIGAGVDNDTMRNGGLITLLASPALLVPGIWLIVDSQARVDVMGGTATAPP